MFPLLSERPEIIQSTDFELQIREEEDDPRDVPALCEAEAKAGVWKLERAK